MNGLIYGKVWEQLREQQLLQQPKAKVFQAIDVGELEFLEIALTSGRSLRDLLEEKLADAEGRAHSMGNYLLLKNEPCIKGPVNPYLEALFEQLGDRALETFGLYKRSDLES